MSDAIHELSDEDFLAASANDFRIDDMDTSEGDTGANEEELAQTTSDELESTTEGAEDDSQESNSQEEDDSDETTETEETDQVEDEPSDADNEYEAQLAEIMAPIKAAGREVTLKTPAEVRQLVQQGVDYSEKMRGMKPHLRTLKMLENNGLLDESKLSYLIDLDKKNPEAISKLLKDSEYDVHSLDSNEESKYTPSDHSVSDSEVELDDVVSRIQDTESFSATMTVVNDEWDDTSKSTLVAKPAMLEALNNHMSNGTFETVMTEVARIKLFGGLANVSDLEAYQQVGRQMQDNGTFNTEKAKGTNTKVSSKPNTVIDTERKDRKRRASPSKKVSSGKSDPSFDPMISLSDEDFLKKFN